MEKPIRRAWITSTNLSLSALSRIILSPNEEHQQHRLSFGSKGYGWYGQIPGNICVQSNSLNVGITPLPSPLLFALTWLARSSQNTSYIPCLSNKCFLKIMIILLRTSVFSIKYCSAWCLSLKTSRFMNSYFLPSERFHVHMPIRKFPVHSSVVRGMQNQAHQIIIEK